MRAGCKVAGVQFLDLDRGAPAKQHECVPIRKKPGQRLAVESRHHPLLRGGAPHLQVRAQHGGPLAGARNRDRVGFVTVAAGREFDDGMGLAAGARHGHDRRPGFEGVGEEIDDRSRDRGAHPHIARGLARDEQGSNQMPVRRRVEPDTGHWAGAVYGRFVCGVVACHRDGGNPRARAGPGRGACGGGRGQGEQSGGGGQGRGNAEDRSHAGRLRQRGAITQP